MRVYGIKENEAGVMEVENTLKAEQRFVGGLIEVLDITEELDLVCNEEGKIDGLRLSVAWVLNGKVIEIIAGDCFVCRHNEEGDFISIKDSDINVIREYLKQIVEKDDGTVCIKE